MHLFSQQHHEIDNSVFILILEIRQLRPVELWNMSKLIYLVYVAVEIKTHLNRVQLHYSKWYLAIPSGYITVKSFVNWKVWKWLQKSYPGNQPGRNFKVTNKKEKPVCRYSSVKLLARIHKTLNLVPGTSFTKENIFF